MKIELNSQASRSFPINAGIPKGSILGHTLFLIFINVLPDVISFQLGLYVDDRNIYSCFNSMSDRTNEVKLGENDLQFVVK